MARPYVVLNVAASVDGKIDTAERHGTAISSERDKARVDALRASVDAVMVGGRTLDEDPRLTVKSADLRAERVVRGLSENPAKVAVVSHLRLKWSGRFVTAGPARIIVFTPDRVSGSTRATRVLGGNDGLRADSAALRARGVELFPMGDGRVDLEAAMATLAELGMSRVLVEGGGSLNFELLRLGLVDEVQLYIAPLVFGGASAPTLADGGGLARSAAIRLSRVEVDTWDEGGVLLRYKVAPRE